MTTFSKINDNYIEICFNKDVEYSSTQTLLVNVDDIMGLSEGYNEPEENYYSTNVQLKMNEKYHPVCSVWTPPEPTMWGSNKIQAPAYLYLDIPKKIDLLRYELRIAMGMDEEEASEQVGLELLRSMNE